MRHQEAKREALNDAAAKLRSPAPYGAGRSSYRASRGSGFTLLELIIVLAIVSILTVAVTLILDPLQMIGRANDSRRMSDFKSLDEAVRLAIANGPSKELGGTDPDGLNTDTCAGETSQTVYVSVPDSETPPTNLPTGWSYSQVSAADLAKVDGNGWMPMDFTNSGNSAPSISNLPLDPKNTFASGYYYSYVCRRKPQQFELTARLASERNRTGGSEDKASTDGGDNIFAYEAGSDLNLDPRAPVGYWPLDGGTSGVIADNDTAGLEDASGNGNDGTADNNNGTGMNWVAGVKGGAVEFDGIDDETRLDSTIVLGNGNWSVSAWAKTSAGGPIVSNNSGGPVTNVIGIYSGTTYYRNYDGVWQDHYGLAAVNDDAWHHFIWVNYNDETMNMYVDGVFDAGGFSSSTTNGGPVNAIGRRWDSSFSGIVDEVAIYDRVLTAEEIAYQYEALKP